MARFFLLLALTFGIAESVDAQILNRIRDRVRSEVEGRLVDRASEATRAVMNAAEDGVRCLFTDPACIAAAQAEGSDVVLVDEDGEPVNRRGERVSADEAEDAIVRAGSGGPPGAGVNANYDFVPGERTLFYEDYTNDRLGNFPQRLDFVDGNWEIVEWQGRRLLRNTGPRGSALRIPLPEALPEQFTIETEVYFPHGNQRFVLLTQPPERAWNQVEHNYFQIAGNHGTGVDARNNTGLPTSLNRDERVHDGLVPIRIIVDGPYAKTFVGENRTANIPNAVLPRSGALHLENIYFADEENPMYLGPIRIAASGVDLYDALQSEGRVTAEGILFDTGSATLQPASFETIQEVAEMLKEHPELRVRIEGHTDAEGTPASNLTLSEARANAVRAMLVGLGVEAGRLEAAGLGQTQPVADNATVEGRAQNRRVELVRL